jgi:hypothetical protein
VEAVQRNGGTAGIVTAIMLAVTFILFMRTGLDPQTASDPQKALPLLAQKTSLFGAIGIFAALAAGFGLVYAIGLFGRLRDRAPTRASAQLALALVGLTGHALGALIFWRGASALTSVFSTDQVAAGHAWLGVNATIQGLNSLGDAFTGASVLVAGWAIAATGALSSALGWLAVVTGVIMLLQLLITSPILFPIAIILTLVWLVWGGSQLRRAAA